MLTRYTVYFPRDAVLHGVVDWPDWPDHAAINDLVAGFLDADPFKQIQVMVGPLMGDMLISAFANPDPPLSSTAPINALASVICRSGALQGNPRLNADSLPAIHGPAVLFERLLIR